jgi:hypothetical protein
MPSSVRSFPKRFTVQREWANDRAHIDRDRAAVAAWPIAGYSIHMSLHAELFGLCNYSAFPLWGGKRRVARGEANPAVPSLGRARL